MPQASFQINTLYSTLCQKMSFNDHGYLGKQSEVFAKEVEKEFAYFLAFAYKINRVAHEFKFRLNVHSKDLQELICASFFIRTLNTFAGIIRLSRLGMTTDAQMLLRPMLEGVIKLKNCARDPQFCDYYRKTHWLNQKPKLNEIIQRAKVGKSVPMDPKEVAERVKDLEKNIGDHNVNPPDLKALADKVGLEDTYFYILRTLGDVLHFDPKTLEGPLTSNKEGEVIALDQKDSTKDLFLVFNGACEGLLVAADTVGDLFEVQGRPDFQGLLNELISISEKHRKS